MHTTQYRTDVGATLAEGLVGAARASLGDTLRSVVYFTPADFDVLYVRQDIGGDPDAVRERKGRLVGYEATGFAEAPVRTALAAESDDDGIGPYEFTVRFHGDGFVARVIEGEAGVLLTTDDMEVDAFEEAATAVRSLLRGRDPAGR
jgi:hypothetical protein